MRGCKKKWKNFTKDTFFLASGEKTKLNKKPQKKLEKGDLGREDVLESFRLAEDIKDWDITVTCSAQV